MRRREILSLLGGAVVWPSQVVAQRAVIPVIGLLSSASATAYVPFVNAIREGLKQSGYIEGQNLSIEYRWADGAYDRLPELAGDLVRRQVSLIITSGGVQAAVAAKRATSTIPIVFHMGDDPVRVGVVESSQPTWRQRNWGHFPHGRDRDQETCTAQRTCTQRESDRVARQSRQSGHRSDN